MQEQLGKSNVELIYCSTEAMAAVMLPKGLSRGVMHVLDDQLDWTFHLRVRRSVKIYSTLSEMRTDYCVLNLVNSNIHKCGRNNSIKPLQ